MTENKTEKKKISIGVSTTYNRIKNLSSLTISSLQNAISNTAKFDFEIFVVVQTGEISKKEIRKINEIMKEIGTSTQDNCTFKYYIDAKKGLSRSRNFLLKNFSGDYLLIADDDVKYNPELFKKLEEILEQNEYDFYTFMIETLNGEKHKNYSVKPYLHNLVTISKVSSIEILLSKSVKSAPLCFDNDFGLGSRWPCGEENIFLADLLRNNMKGVFIPIVVGKHPLPEDLSKMEKDDLMCKGAAITRMYGKYLSILPIIFLWIKRIRVTKFSGLKYMLQGRKSYLKTRKEFQNGSNPLC